MSARPLIFVIDDDSSTLKALERLLRSDCEVRTFSDPEVAAAQLASEAPVLVLTDYTMPQMSGLDFLKKVRALSPNTVRAVLSGHVETHELADAINHNLIHRFFVKPWENDVLKLQIIECISQYKTLVENNHLATLALTDPITQLGNHRFFQEQLRVEIERAKRHNRPLSLLMIDVDHFKNWNDQHGHPAGDQLLKDIAAHLLKSLRSIDWVARYGGDEFAAILPDTQLPNAFDVAERLRKTLGEATLSLGVAAFPTHGATPETLIAAADQALYKAKKQGRNQTSIATA